MAVAPARMDVAVETYELRVVEPGKSGGEYVPILPQLDTPGAMASSGDVYGHLFCLALFPILEVINITNHLGKGVIGPRDEQPGAYCRMQAEVTLTWPDGRTMHATVAGKGGDDNVTDRYWGEALRAATDRALDEFAEQLRTAVVAGPGS